jgi:hypothetical protein
MILPGIGKDGRRMGRREDGKIEETSEIIQHVSALLMVYLAYQYGR